MLINNVFTHNDLYHYQKTCKLLRNKYEKVLFDFLEGLVYQ
jgi:hypothetical protein